MFIFLIGMPGSGKSYWMGQLAAFLECPAIDMDDDIVLRSGKTIPELFAVSETHFREAERESLQAILRENSGRIVIATGGGTPCYPDNMDLMKATGCVLYLHTPLETLIRNIEHQDRQRPLLAGRSGIALREKLLTLYRQRKEIYEQAHAIIHTDTATLATFAEALFSYQNLQNSSG